MLYLAFAITGGGLMLIGVAMGVVITDIIKKAAIEAEEAIKCTDT